MRSPANLAERFSRLPELHLSYYLTITETKRVSVVHKCSICDPLPHDGATHDATVSIHKWLKERVGN